MNVVVLAGAVGRGAACSSDADDAVRMLDADVGGEGSDGRLKLVCRATVVPTPFFIWLSVRRIDPPILLPPSVLRRRRGSCSFSGQASRIASATAGTGSPFVVSRAPARWSIGPGTCACRPVGSEEGISRRSSSVSSRVLPREDERAAAVEVRTKFL